MVDRYDQLDDVLGTAATAFLGITLRCARCHDHKFEPFSQVDYYRMLAVFEPLKRPQIDRTDLDRRSGPSASWPPITRALAKADAEFAETWGRIEGLVKTGDRPTGCSGGRSEGWQAAGKANVASAAGRRGIPRRAVQANACAAVSSSRSSRRSSRPRFVKSRPPEVKAALDPWNERLAAIKAAAQGTSSRLHLV